MADDVIYVNAVEGAKRVMGNAKLYAKLLFKFKEDQSLQQMGTALSEGDMEKARTAAHTLKGLAANLSLTELYRQVAEMEIQIKAGSVKEQQMALVKTVNEQTLAEIDRVIVQYA